MAVTAVNARINIQRSTIRTHRTDHPQDPGYAVVGHPRYAGPFGTVNPGCVMVTVQKDQKLGPLKMDALWLKMITNYWMIWEVPPF